MLKLADKKIVFLFTPGPIGGAEKIVIGGVNALIQSGLNVELWVIKEERVPQVGAKFIDLATSAGLKCRTFSSNSIFDFNLLSELRKAFAQTVPDIVHAHGFKAAFYGRLSTAGAFIITHHGKTGHTLKVRIYEYLELMMMKKSSAVIAVSNEMKNNLISTGVKPTKVHLVENFLTFSPIPREVHNEPKIKLVFIGRLSPEKGCQVLIEALIKLNDPTVHLKILGDGIEKINLEQMVSNSTIKSQVDFLGFTKDVTPHLAQADVLIMPSFREGQPLTLIEACIMGLPVIASNVGGIPELVHDNQNGFLFKAGDIDELASKIELFKHEKLNLNKAAEKIKSSYLDRFDAFTWSKNTQTVYQTVLSQR